MTVSEVAPVMVTVCTVLYLPAAGEMVGAVEAVNACACPFLLAIGNKNSKTARRT